LYIYGLIELVLLNFDWHIYAKEAF